MQKGKKVKRKCWNVRDGCFKLNMTTGIIEDDEFEEHIIMDLDWINATDWEVCEEPKKTDIMNPDNYSYRAVELCYMQGCNNVAEWWIDEDVFGICDKCLKKLEEPKKTLWNKRKDGACIEDLDKNLEYLEIKDVKEALKEFIFWLKQNDMVMNYSKKAKEIFGSELIEDNSQEELVE